MSAVLCLRQNVLDPRLITFRVTGLQAVDLAARHGEHILQFGANVANVEFAVLSTNAVVKQGRNVLHSPMGAWIVDAPLSPPPSAVTLSLRKHGSARYLEYDELLHAGAPGTTTSSTSVAPLCEGLSLANGGAAVREPILAEVDFDIGATTAVIARRPDGAGQARAWSNALLHKHGVLSASRAAFGASHM